MTILDEDRCWQAVERRDRTQAGVFLVCVKTTGIYCHPFCAGRPLRKNVIFVETVEEARAGGFRACLRCKPDHLPVAEPDAAKSAQKNQPQK